MIKPKLALALVLSLSSFTLNAQEVFVNADLVSEYIWRGMKCGNASIQPCVGVRYAGFTLSAWGSTEFREENNEIDLTLEYQRKGWRLRLNNVNHSSSHTLEGGVGYTFGKRFPLAATWYSTVAGKDYRENGKRRWSSYLELIYPFTCGNIELYIEAGGTPWRSSYADGPNLNNFAVSATRKIQLSKCFALSVNGKLGYNPVEEFPYFVFGISL